nr:hypothetical protein GCM10025699_29220 [Microbacterium flavescens]
MPAAPATHSADVLVIGWGLAGLVAASEAVAAGKRVVIVDQEPRSNLGGQAWWSFGGLFFVDSPEQRRMGIKDSLELARQDWFGNAGFDREEDAWPKRWAEAYLQFAHEEKRSWLREKGVGFFPVVGWAERGGYTATGPGNSVPRFHVTWGTGPGVVAPSRPPSRPPRARVGSRSCPGTRSPGSPWSTAWSPGQRAPCSRRRARPAATPPPARSSDRSR